MIEIIFELNIIKENLINKFLLTSVIEPGTLGTGARTEIDIGLTLGPCPMP